jgi:hypothetical protein
MKAESMPDDLTSVATELHWLTIAEAARLFEKRQLSPVEAPTGKFPITAPP